MSIEFPNKYQEQSSNQEVVNKELEKIKAALVKLVTKINMPDGHVSGYDFNLANNSIDTARTNIASQLLFQSFPEVRRLLMNTSKDKGTAEIKADLLEVSKLLWEAAKGADTKNGQRISDIVGAVDGINAGLYDLDTNAPGVKNDLLVRSTRALTSLEVFLRDAFAENDLSYLLDLNISESSDVMEVENILSFLKQNPDELRAA